MIAKINDLKTKTQLQDVKALCETTLNAFSTAIYNNVSVEARLEIERVSLENLFEELSKHSEDTLITEWLETEQRLYILRNLGLRKAINTLLVTEGRFHPTLAGILEDYKQKLEEDSELLLYESFISATSGFNYLPAVSTELDAIASRVKKYKNDIDISKIIEMMKKTRSSYLLPLIESYVNNYLKNKTEMTKHFLKEALIKYSYDPFIRDIINLVTLDATDLQLEYANGECGIEERLYSPIVYLGEGEALFNIKGTYYIKKGNNINKVPDVELERLDPVFTSLCESVNNPNVVIDKKDIKIYFGEDFAIINEAGVKINDQLLDNKQFEEAYQVSQWSGKAPFFFLTENLRDNFNDIIEIDFAKRVYLKQNEAYAADIFKLRDNIFITTFDPHNNKTTFYRNINPIQAERVMMEHLRFDVSKTFEDILPNKNKILAQIDETKREYLTYINELEIRIGQFSEASDNISKSVVEALTEELDEVKNDFKDYSNEVERYVRPLDEDLTITIQDDKTNQTHTVTVPTDQLSGQGQGQAAKGENEMGGGDAAGTQPGAENIKDGPASQITFNDQESELISDSPSIPTDSVDMGADEIEADADEIEAEKDAEGGEEGEGGIGGPGAEGEVAGAEAGNVPGAEGELAAGGTGGAGAGGELGSIEPEAGAPSEQPGEETPETPEDETTLTTPEEEDKDKNKKELNDAVETPNLERTSFDKEKQEPKKNVKVYLTKHLAK